MKKNNSKREFLKLCSSSVLLLKLFSFGFFLSKPALASAWKEAWFSTNDLMETLKVMGVKDITESKKITVSAPETAENGAYVGVGINTSIENVDMVAILVDKNPNILSGYFEFNSKVRPDIATKIKMAESSDIIAVIKTINDQYYMARKSVNVTLGGCGS